MARKKKGHDKEPNHERWLVSYGDFITLLFAVFVTLYAMSQTDKKKVEEVIAGMRDSFGYSSTSPGSKLNVIDSSAINVFPSLGRQSPPGRGKGKGGEHDFRSTKAAIEAYLMKARAQQKVSVSLSRRGLVVSLKEAGFFDSGSATLKQSSYALLNDVIHSLASYSNAIRIEGHTDNIPISSRSFPTNWELSTARATNVLQYLASQVDFEPGRMCAAGYGQYRPVADNASDEGRSKNRRVDIVLLSEQSERNEP